MKIFHSRWLAAAWVVLALLFPAYGEEADPVLLRFAVMGGCRLTSEDCLKLQAQIPSSANQAQLLQTLSDLSQLTEPVDLFFQTGDLVNNLVIDQGQTLRAQLQAWIQLVNRSAWWDPAKVYLVAGNHEVLQYVYKPIETELPNPPCYEIWRDWLISLGVNRGNGNGPHAEGANPDSLVGDQSQVTFSFNREGIHFVVVETDSLNTQIDQETGHPFIGWIPIHWIRADIEKAQADPHIKAIFMLGHKPLCDPELGEEHTPILNTHDHDLSDQLRQVFLRNSKFRAYLTGHEHLWVAHRMGPNERSGPWQIIIGNGGSKLNKHWAKKGNAYFGFTVFKVYRSGKVGVMNYRRPNPSPPQRYLDGPTEPAKPEPEWNL